MGDRIKVIMDCDPGIDDGIALAYAAAHQDELELLAITTFAGNATIDKVTKNALELVDFYGLKVPVARGQERPLVKEVIHAEEFHGETGLGHCVLPETGTKAASDNAVFFIREDRPQVGGCPFRRSCRILKAACFQGFLDAAQRLTG